MDSNVIKKIRDLLAMTGDRGASDAEAATAMGLARRLMEKHHVSEDDLQHSEDDDFAKVDAADCNEYRCFIGARAFFWERGLAGFVAKFVGVRLYRDTNPQIVRRHGIVQLDANGKRQVAQSIVFFGISEDAFIAAELYDELRTLVASMAVARWGQVYKGDGAAYCEGFVCGLISRHNEADEEQRLIAVQAADDGNQNGLILMQRRTDLVARKQEKAERWIQSRGVKLKSSRRSYGSQAGSNEAFVQGETDGRNADVSASRRRKIAN